MVFIICIPVLCRWQHERVLYWRSSLKINVIQWMECQSKFRNCVAQYVWASLSIHWCTSTQVMVQVYPSSSAHPLLVKMSGSWLKRLCLRLKAVTFGITKNCFRVLRINFSSGNRSSFYCLVNQIQILKVTKEKKVNLSLRQAIKGKQSSLAVSGCSWFEIFRGIQNQRKVPTS